MPYKLLGIQVGNLGAPVEEWTVGGTALTSLMDVERRRGIPPLFPLSTYNSNLYISIVESLGTCIFQYAPNYKLCFISVSGKFKPVIKKAMVELEGNIPFYQLYCFHCTMKLTLSSIRIPLEECLPGLLQSEHDDVPRTQRSSWTGQPINLLFCCIVNVSGAPFKKFASLRDGWTLKNRYISPGIIHIIFAASFFYDATFT